MGGRPQAAGRFDVHREAAVVQVMAGRLGPLELGRVRIELPAALVIWMTPWPMGSGRSGSPWDRMHAACLSALAAAAAFSAGGCSPSGVYF